MDLNGRSVTLVRTHAICHLAGLGQLTGVIDVKDQQNSAYKHKLTMVRVSSGVMITDTKKRSFLIPDTNIICMEFGPE
jgi:hypothetical protein